MPNTSLPTIRGSLSAGLVLLAAVVVGTTPLPVSADSNGDRGRAYCSKTANYLLKACRAEIKDDYWISFATCVNVSDPNERRACANDGKAEKREARAWCQEQFEARLDVCHLVGGERYDPDFDPANFVHPDAIGDTVAPNPYFPLIPNTEWVYEGGDETITVTVTEETKLIEGVTCRVVTDLVTEDDAAIEDTDDWYAQDLDGNVWYCGEVAENFESFEGDDPEVPELVDIEGSWKTGRDGANPGILMLAAPQTGDVYRQEMLLGEAEDVAQVIATAGTESVPAAACTNDCVVTRDFSPIEPGVNENKYYAPGVGLILEVDMEGNRVELIEFNMP